MSHVDEHRRWLGDPITQEIKADLESHLSGPLLEGILSAARVSTDPSVKAAAKAYFTTKSMIETYFQEKHDPEIEDPEDSIE